MIHVEITKQTVTFSSPSNDKEARTAKLELTVPDDCGAI